MKKTKQQKETRPTMPAKEVTGDGSGRQVQDVIPDDEASVGKELFEQGMREPTTAPMADDQRRK